MPWSSQGGNGGGEGPWGGGSRGGGGGGPWSPGPGVSRPDVEEIIRKGQDRFRSLLPRGFGGGRGILVLGLVVLVLWLLSGFYRVLPNQQGVVLRFGAWTATTEPGLNYHLPLPIERALTPDVTAISRVDVGFRAAREGTRVTAERRIPEEALMLTGDENIVELNFTVLWRISDAGKYLFNIRDPKATVKVAAESAMREIIARNPIQMALTTARRQIEQEVRALLQEVLDSYETGIFIVEVQLQRVDPPEEVIDAFRDVQRAEADKERARNEAQAYRNDIVPRAEGEAARIVHVAEGYKQQMVNQAVGEASRFLAVYEAFKTNEDVTRQRIYLETMQDVLSKTNKIIIDSSAQGGSGVVPYLPLPEVAKRRAKAGGEETK
jgi:membrane protease subunit HflK